MPRANRRHLESGSAPTTTPGLVGAIQIQQFHSDHDLYKTGDPDAPDTIKDGNGEVALAMCRKCNRGEAELVEPCVGKVGLSGRIATIPTRHDNDNPLWQGPCAAGPLGGITQSMLVRFLSCRERFRLKYVLGLEPHDKWSHRLGYGNMWHACEEGLAAGGSDQVWRGKLAEHVRPLYERYPLQREELDKWWNVCQVQFPEYVKYWAEHPDVQNRTPLMQEQVFDVPYTLPSGRTVRLRGKWDSVDLIREETVGLLGRHKQEVEGIYLQENKTKGDIDKMQVERQLKFDLQTMMYLIALHSRDAFGPPTIDGEDWWKRVPVLGVRYNIVRRPLSGGKGTIKPHAAKYTKTKVTPAETAEEFYERLRRDYLAAEPDYWFFRVRAEVSARDIQVFRETCLDPLLETVCVWYEQLTNRWDKDNHPDAVVYGSTAIPSMNYRTPFGVWSALEEGGATEYDHYLETGSEVGLRRVEELFTELK